MTTAGSRPIQLRAVGRLRCWTGAGRVAAVLVLACAVPAPRPAGAGAFASKIGSAGSENAKGQAAVRGRTGGITAEDALIVIKGEQYTSVVAMVTGQYLEKSKFEGAATVSVVRAFASRRGQYGKAATMAAWSPHAEQIVKALAGSRSAKDHALAAAIVATYAYAMSLDELDGRVPAPSTGGGGKKKKGAKKGAAQVRKPIPSLDVAASVETLLAKSSKDALELTLLAAAYGKVGGVKEQVAKLDLLGAPAAEAARLFYMGRTGQELPAGKVQAAFRTRINVDSRLAKVTPALNSYNIRGNALLYACQAVGAAGDERFVDQLHEMLNHKDLRVQIEAAWAIGGVGAGRSVAVLLKKLAGEPPWPVKVAVLSAVGAIPSLESIEPLLRMYDSETGRFRQDVVYALASINGGVPQGNPYDWASWWQANRDTFRIDRGETKRFRKKFRVQDMPVIPLADFYGVEIASSRVVFVLDTSMSMKGDKIVALKETMAFTVQGMPGGLKFNVVDFGGVVNVMRPGAMIEARHVSKAATLIRDMSLTGGTRTFDAMEVACYLADADTLVYLPDGAPVAGQFESWDRIIRTFDVYTRYRPLAIHCIHYKRGGAGGGNKSMDALALRNTGTSIVSNEATAKARARAIAKKKAMTARGVPTGGVTAALEGADAKFSDEAVEKAIAGAVKYVLSRQYSDGSWQPYVAGHRQETGPTALVVYALLESGMSPQNTNIARALAWLEKHPAETTYSLVCRCSAWLAASWKTKGRYRGNLRRESKQLVDAAGAAGAYTYPASPGASHKMWDNSNSQFGLLGVWAAKQLDVEVPTTYWQAVMRHWERTQLRGGGWNYGPGSASKAATGTMTAGGVASLFVCFDNLHAEEFLGCGRKMDYKPILRGLAWFDKNFAKTVENWGNVREGYYYMYGVERVGLAAGYKYFGTKDWYKIGAGKLIGWQQADGSWLGVHDNPANQLEEAKARPGAEGNLPVSRPHRLSDTCFALLFLIRGRRPVLFNKLEFTGDWNNRPRDLAQLTRWITRTFEKPVNWQIVNLKVPVRELHDAPILYISGSKAPRFSQQDMDKLRRFVWEGGCLFSVTECDGKEFAKGIRELYAKLFGDYELVPAGKDHPIYRAHFPLAGAPRLSIVSNGVRPLAVHTDMDLSKSWQLRNVMTERFAFQTAANVFMYVTDRGSLRYRGTSPWPEPRAVAPAKRVTLFRLKHSGNCDPEPLALKRFALMMRNEARTEVQVLRPASPASLARTPAKVALMTGTGEFKLTDAEKQVVKEFVERGGTLVIDAAGGPNFSKGPRPGTSRLHGFAASAEQAVEDIFGAGSLRRLSTTSPVLNAPGVAVTRARYRRRTQKRLGSPRTASLRAVLVDGRPGVIYSREDITGGLVGYQASTVDGYAPRTAFEILRSIVLSVDKGKTIAPPKPKTPTSKPAAGKAKPARQKGKGGKARPRKAEPAKSTPAGGGAEKDAASQPGPDPILAPEPKYSPPGRTTAGGR